MLHSSIITEIPKRIHQKNKSNQLAIGTFGTALILCQHDMPASKCHVNSNFCWYINRQFSCQRDWAVSNRFSKLSIMLKITPYLFKLR